MNSEIRLFPLLLNSLLEDAIRSYLSLDPASRAYLKPLAGKIIALEFTAPGHVVYLSPTETGIHLLGAFEGAPDAALTGSLLAFARMGLGGAPRRFLFSGQIQVTGDTETARRFQSLFQKLAIDWEGQLARLAGETVSSTLFGLLRAGRRWSEDTAEAFRLNLAEYLQEETRDLPARAEANIFYRDVDGIRTDSERLEARIRRLQAASEPSA
jgi:ubiquinone biosynthesis protein UbiJ